ncbi:MAG: hypothetical protein B6D35_11635 [Candidatus Brocadia sp. UTAMX2]|nr:MAG: hypothetical protein B6D35_11635 [Candidatus Brocadia sp. UTAMX2]
MYMHINTLRSVWKFIEQKNICTENAKLFKRYSQHSQMQMARWSLFPMTKSLEDAIAFSQKSSGMSTQGL